jgi:hypothetical protein
MRRWKDNIKEDLKEIGREGIHGTDLSQDRKNWRTFVNTTMIVLEP